MKNNVDIESVVHMVKKKFKEDVYTFDELDEFANIETWVSFGIPEVDLLVETYSIPPGITEISGNPQSGKTTLGLTLVREVQSRGGLPIIISTERRDNKVYAETIGVDTKKVLVFKAKTIEACFARIEDVTDIIREYHKTIPVVLILDSLGGTPTRAELNADEDQEFMAVAAKVIKKGLRKTTQILDDYNITLLIINQTYKKIGRVFGKKTESYGGEGVKFHSQIRMEIQKIGTIKVSEKRKIGQICRLELLKSDFSVPLRTIDTLLLFGYGFIPGKSMLEFGLKNGILEDYKNNGYALKKFPKYRWSSIEKYCLLSAENPKFRRLFRSLLKNKVHTKIEEMRNKK